MKRIFLFLLFASSQLSSAESFDIQARVAYFYPQDHKIREIYGKHGFPEYEVEASVPLAWCLNNCSYDWDIWTNLSYYQKTGHSTFFKHHTRMNDWALNFGVKHYFCACERLRPYLGFGAGAAYVRFHDTGPLVNRHVHKWGAAILAKSGIRYDVTCQLFVDLFVDYSYHWFKFHGKTCVHHRNANTGGVKAGIGLGYQF